MRRIDAEAFFDPAQIAQSGQCFRMEETAQGCWRILAADRAVELRRDGDEWVLSCGEEAFEGFWRSYFDLDTDYGAFLERIDPEDAYLREAAEFGKGIRILRQDLWEMIITFLITQQNHIPRIRRCIQNICERYGEEKTAEWSWTPAGDSRLAVDSAPATGRPKAIQGQRPASGGPEPAQGSPLRYHAFPTPEALARATEEDLRACNLGYRAKYLIRTAQTIVNGGLDLQALPSLDCAAAKQELLKLYGVGEKVADCICLFGLHHLEAFPVDTHIRQAIAAHYPDGFPAERYRGFEGVMQQYLFFYHLFRG
ncbi:MAG: DNA glycosylase [Eubacteriales bacterium]|nr:DNA glycosylase [Eubacteriales bacterium]